MIRAEVHTDDYAYTARFNAVPFFAQVTLADLVKLDECDWGGDYPADDVAMFFEGAAGYADVTAVFAHTLRRNQGFECHIHVPDAVRWLRTHRPELSAQFHAAIGRTPEDVLDGQDDEPFWDRDPSWTGAYQDADPVPATA